VELTPLPETGYNEFGERLTHNPGSLAHHSKATETSREVRRRSIEVLG